MNYLQQIIKWKKENKVIGFTASTFDLLHPGHIDMLTFAKSQCDILIVGLLTDPTISRTFKLKPIETTFERFIRLQALNLADIIIPFDTEEDLINMLLILKPNIRFIGEEYKNEEHTGKNIKDIQIIYNERKHNYSSTSLKKRIKMGIDNSISLK